jgi:anti-sigma factor ChrR (cupin superfamily)
MKHLSDDQIKKLRNRTLEGDDFLTVDDHLAVCEECRRNLNNLKANLQDLRIEIIDEAASATEHPEFEQIAALVENKLNDSDRKRLLSHLAECTECRDEVEDLRSFREQMPEGSRSFNIKKKQPFEEPSNGWDMRLFWH